MQVVAILAAALVGTAAAGGYGGAAPAAPAYPAPVAPVATPCPTNAPAVPIAPIAPVVVAPAPAPVAPVVAAIKAKVHTCGGWNNKYNKKACATVNAVKCTMGSGAGSKYKVCSADVCCGTATPVAPVAPTTPTTPTFTVVTCAQYCSTNSLQCVVTTAGGCAVEGAYGQYSQCSQALCCGTPAPQPPAPQPQPQVISCKQVAGGYGWKCPVYAAYSCAVGAAYGAYPACSFEVCCLQPYPNPTPNPNPCSGCKAPYGYCPAYCQDYKPINPCANCGNYCPSWCGSDNGCNNCGGAYQAPCPPGCSSDPCVINPTTVECVCKGGATDACCAAFPDFEGCGTGPVDPCDVGVSDACCAANPDFEGCGCFLNPGSCGPCADGVPSDECCAAEPTFEGC